MFRMIIKTETTDAHGRPSVHTERVPHIPASQVDERRAVARLTAPFGSTRTIKVVEER